MLAIQVALFATLILCPAILIWLSERVAAKRRLIWAISSLLPPAISVAAIFLGAYNPHGDIGPFIIFFVAFIGPWIVLLAFKMIRQRPAS